MRHPRRAERDADAQLMPPCVGAREQQVRDIGARDEQHERDDDHQDIERIPVLPAERIRAVGGWPQRERFVQIPREIVRAQIRRKRRFTHLRLYASQRRSRAVDALASLQPRDDSQPPIRTLIQGALAGAANERLRRERDDSVNRNALIDAGKVRTGDADDRERHAIQRDGLPKHVGRAAVVLLPEAIREHRHLSRTGACASPHIIVGCERPAENRRDAEHVEEGAARHDGIGRLLWPPRREIEALTRVGECAVEQAGRALAQLLPERVAPGGALGPRHHLHQLLRVFHW